MTTQILADEMETRDLCLSYNYGMHIYGTWEKLRICFCVTLRFHSELYHITQDFQIECLCHHIIPIK
jgi:hypothetical protein